MGLPAEGTLRAAVPADPLSPGAAAFPAAHRAARDAARTGLYVHVPFCAARCTYCDFSTGSLSAAAVERYLAALEREAELRAPAGDGVAFTSVFFGGGTPSALSARHFRRVWAALTRHFTLAPDAEVTLEANPESVRDPLLAAWAECGVNRLSFGAQSFDVEELHGLGRIHPAERPAEAVELAGAHGFRRLSIDLMFGFPGHGPRTWRTTLARTLALELEHVSAYCFIPEAGTPLGDAVLRGDAALPDDAAQADAYAELTETLGAAGYSCYETSNFCRPGGEARHNLVYWLRRPYLALGPSAHGFSAGRRYGNHFALPRWAAALEAGALPEAESECETAESRARESVMLGLRLGEGLDARDGAPDAWGEIERRYGVAFARAAATGRLERTRHGWRIAAAHRFVADDVIAWIEAAAEDAAAAPLRAAG